MARANGDRQRTITDKTIPYSETGKAEMGEVLLVTDVDPQTTHKYVTYDFKLTGSGLNIAGYSGTATSLFVTYRKEAPLLNGENWSAGSYDAGTQVYHKTTGDFTTKPEHLPLLWNPATARGPE